MARASSPCHHSFGSFPMMSVPGSSDNRRRADSWSPSATAFVHRSTIRRISSDGSTRESVINRGHVRNRQLSRGLAGARESEVIIASVAASVTAPSSSYNALTRAARARQSSSAASLLTASTRSSQRAAFNCCSSESRLTSGRWYGRLRRVGRVGCLNAGRLGSYHGSPGPEASMRPSNSHETASCSGLLAIASRR